jgi:hypothetical protein
VGPPVFGYATGVGRLNIRTDGDIERGIREYMRANKLTRSQASRELLRQVLKVAEPVTRGWLEGFAQGHAEHQKTVHEATKKLPLPRTKR